MLLSPAFAQKTIVIQTWAGAFIDAMNSVKPDLEKATGTKIEFVTQASSVAGLQRLEAQKANPQVDLWMTADATAAKALASGVIRPVPADLVPNLKDIPEQLIFPSGPTMWSSPRGIFYRADRTPFEIKTWEDLWDPRLKGMITTSIDQDKGMFIMIAALLAGGNEKNIDPGFEKLKALKANLGVIYKADAEALKLVQAGEANVAGYGVLGVVYKLLGPGSNYRFVMPAKPQFLSVNVITMLKGRPNEAEAAKVLNAILDPGIQERIVEQLGSIPSNRNAKAPSSIRDVIPPLGDLFTPDWDYVNAHYGAWVERWNREILTR
ncbi:extracellular solute-binding protein [Bradyrhizobium sp. NP1]|uniref:ABC transporter substrate-binding protein n=1 Tax=Bradyrhizobium sp. NP1 TaxID=3049772 RepID=UPI0025A51C56|nr:extracellular solute-binding protein [Bradyrhizobium sp. NP1]WJR81791.1 extracellular solute-binding protein [Bradyrhizobium sp. NP1]